MKLEKGKGSETWGNDAYECEDFDKLTQTLVDGAHPDSSGFQTVCSQAVLDLTKAGLCDSPCLRGFWLTSQ